MLAHTAFSKHQADPSTGRAIGWRPGSPTRCMQGLQSMGSLRDDWPCGWCGRPGALRSVALCGSCGPGGLGCLFGVRGPSDVMRDVLRAIFQLSLTTAEAPLALRQPEILTILARML